MRNRQPKLILTGVFQPVKSKETSGIQASLNRESIKKRP
jgi:hypothetical protein